jgi:hypothetical protein
MACVGDEASLALDRPLEPPEHRVQRLGQPRELVLSLTDVQAPARIFPRDRRRLSAHLLHRAERCSCKPVPKRRAQQEQDRPSDDELGQQLTQRVVAVAE